MPSDSLFLIAFSDNIPWQSPSLVPLTKIIAAKRASICKDARVVCLFFCLCAAIIRAAFYLRCVAMRLQFFQDKDWAAALGIFCFFSIFPPEFFLCVALCYLCCNFFAAMRLYVTIVRACEAMWRNCSPSAAHPMSVLWMHSTSISLRIYLLWK